MGALWGGGGRLSSMGGWEGSPGGRWGRQTSDRVPAHTALTFWSSLKGTGLPHLDLRYACWGSPMLSERLKAAPVFSCPSVTSLICRPVAAKFSSPASPPFLVPTSRCVLDICLHLDVRRRFPSNVAGTEFLPSLPPLPASLPPFLCSFRWMTSHPASGLCLETWEYL